MKHQTGGPVGEVVLW